MQQDHRRAVLGPVLFIGEIEQVGSDLVRLHAETIAVDRRPDHSVALAKARQSAVICAKVRATS
jgi:hypothetical protein